MRYTNLNDKVKVIIMIKGIGLDIIEMGRIKEGLERSGKLANRILTEKEREIYANLPSGTRKTEFAAGRFAAKEAFAKALGTGLGKLSFQDIEILPGERGAPELKTTCQVNGRIFVSISHSKEYAVAQVIIEE